MTSQSRGVTVSQRKVSPQEKHALQRLRDSPLKVNKQLDEIFKTTAHEVSKDLVEEFLFPNASSQSEPDTRSFDKRKPPERLGDSERNIRETPKKE